MTRLIEHPRRGLIGPLLPVLLGVLAAGGCGPGGHESARDLQIHPAMTSVPEGGTARFTGRVAGAPVTGVQWSATGGSITSEGVYTAPPRSGWYQVQATYENLTAVAVVNVVGPGAPATFHATASSACGNMPLRSTGTTYYFCDCQAGAEAGCAGHEGDDANPGTSPDAPKRTWTAAIGTFNAMNGGDTIALCKGGAWAVTSTSPADCSNNLTNTRCAAGASLTDPANASTCDIRDYTPSWGGTAKPMLMAGDTNPVRFVNRFGGSVNGVRILNLAFQGTNAGPNGGTYHDQRAFVSGSCTVANDSDWLFCNNTFDRLRLAMQPANTGTVTNLVVLGNRFTMIDLDAILIGNSANLRIDSNFFDNNGAFTPHPATGNAAHAVYLAGDSVYNSTNTSVVHNEFRRSGAGGKPGPCGAGILVGHEFYEGVNIENNILDAGAGALGGCWAVDLRAAGSPPTHYRQMALRRNWINGGGVGISVGQAPGVVIENNVVTLLSPIGWKQGIQTPQDRARSAGHTLPGYAGADDVENDATVRNNTIYITGGNAATRGIVVGTEGTGHVVANNAVFTDGGVCISTTLAGSAYAFVGNNSCFDAAQVSPNDVFASPPTDFSPAAGSPLRGAGDAAHAPVTDFTLKTRLSPPSVGAFEP